GGYTRRSGRWEAAIFPSLDRALPRRFGTRKPTWPLRSLLFVIPGVFACVVAATAFGQSTPEATYSELFYPSGGLRIQAYLYRPDGAGPFPVVIYNHGSRVGRERASVPNEFIGKMLTRAGYVVLVPERRGYGKSEGPIWRPPPRGHGANDDRA